MKIQTHLSLSILYDINHIDKSKKHFNFILPYTNHSPTSPHMILILFINTYLTHISQNQNKNPDPNIRKSIPFLLMMLHLHEPLRLELNRHFVFTVPIQYQNQQIETIIAQSKNPSEIVLIGCKLNDEGMKIVISQAINNQQCTNLKLVGNQITESSASILADALFNNKTLK